MNWIVEIEDLAALEDMRESVERAGWNSLVDGMSSTLEERGEELTQEIVDEAVLFFGIQAWPLPHTGTYQESQP